jgi:hypothetical protein
VLFNVGLFHHHVGLYFKNHSSQGENTMQNYQDKYLKQQLGLIVQAQANGKLVALEVSFADRYPLPALSELPGVHPARYGGYEIDGYPFRRSGVPGAWDINAAKLQGVPVVSLKLASVHAQEAGVLVTLADGTQLTLDETWTAGEKPYDLLSKVNRRLAGDRLLCAAAWEVTWEDTFERPHTLSLATEHVSVVCSSVAWDAENHQLVAATLVSPSTQSMRAITSTLSTNSKKSLTLSVDGASHYLQNTRRGFTAVSGSLTASGAEGHLLSIAHPLTGNPQEQPADFFYALAPKGQKLADVFNERLALAVPWPTQPDWTGYLMEVGTEKNLVRPLDACGPDFESALCVQKNETSWKAVIERGLAEGWISIPSAG